MDTQTPSEHRPVRRLVREVLETALIAAVMYVAISAAIGRFEVQQVSMEPNFYAGQRVIVARWERLLTPLLARIVRAEDGHEAAPPAFQRGQVVVFYSTPAHDQIPLVKRVIGVPGDEILIADSRVWIDGQVLDEPYVNGLPTDCVRYCGPMVLEPGQYFMMGDNRTHSGDSRAFGPVAEDEIVGHVIARYWPLDALRVYL